MLFEFIDNFRCEEIKGSKTCVVKDVTINPKSVAVIFFTVELTCGDGEDEMGRLDKGCIMSFTSGVIPPVVIEGSK